MHPRPRVFCTRIVCLTLYMENIWWAPADLIAATLEMLPYWELSSTSTQLVWVLHSDRGGHLYMYHAGMLCRVEGPGKQCLQAANRCRALLHSSLITLTLCLTESWRPRRFSFSFCRVARHKYAPVCVWKAEGGGKLAGHLSFSVPR